jgi:hypothetical protein
MTVSNKTVTTHLNCTLPILSLLFHILPTPPPHTLFLSHRCFLNLHLLSALSRSPPSSLNGKKKKKRRREEDFQIEEEEEEEKI